MTSRKKVLRPLAGSRKKDSDLDFDSETFYNPESNENTQSLDNNSLPNSQTPKREKKLKKLSDRTNSFQNSEFEMEENLYGNDISMEQEKPKNQRRNNSDRLEVENINELAMLSDEDEETIKRNTENKRLRRLRKAETVAADDSQMLEEENKSTHSEPKAEHHNCAICLSEITDIVAKLDCCTHVFCFSCINEWSKVANQCPLCKNRFRRIFRFSPDGSKLGDLRVKFKNQVAAEEPAFEIIENTDECCYACGSESNPLKMLVCDECNFYCCHIYCTDPPMHRVPLEPWYCNFCRPPRPQPTYRKSSTATPESAVTQSIRKALGENSILQKLFEKADKEMEKKFKATARRSSTSRSAERSRTPRGRTRQRSTTKSRTTKKTKGSPRERTRTKSRKSAVGKTGKKNKDKTKTKTKRTRSLSKVKKTKKTSGSRQKSGRKST